MFFFLNIVNEKKGNKNEEQKIYLYKIEIEDKIKHKRIS